MRINLTTKFTFDGIHYDHVVVPDYLQVGHQDAYLEHKHLGKERMGIPLCAAMVEMPLPAFKKVSGEDFLLIAEAVKKVFDEAEQKKANRVKKKSRSRG